MSVILFLSVSLWLLKFRFLLLLVFVSQSFSSLSLSDSFVLCLSFCSLFDFVLLYSFFSCVCRVTLLSISIPFVMAADDKLAEGHDRKDLLSFLWIFALCNYLYADVMTLMDPAVLNQMITKTTPVPITSATLFAAALLMESAIAMILLSRVLSYTINRWANIIVGFVHTGAVFASLFTQTPAAYYLVYASVEIACTSFIMWYAWTWRLITPEQAAASSNDPKTRLLSPS